jgi:hypothetical protein
MQYWDMLLKVVVCLPSCAFGSSPMCRNSKTYQPLSYAGSLSPGTTEVFLSALVMEGSVSISTLLKHLRMLWFNMFRTVKMLSNIVCDTCCAGHAEWTDGSHTECLVLWRSIQDWANYILNFVSVWPFFGGEFASQEIDQASRNAGLLCLCLCLWSVIRLLIRIMFVANWAWIRKLGLHCWRGALWWWNTRIW